MAFTARSRGEQVNAIKRYIEIAERFSWTLARRIREREKETIDDEMPDDLVLILLDQYHEKERLLYRIRNELDTVTSSAISEINTLGLDATPVSKTTLAAWHYHDRFQEEWFNCHSFLRVALQADSKTHSKYPGLTEMFREDKANPKLSASEKTYRKVAERYRKSLDRNDRPTVEELKRWLERAGNH